MGNPLSFVEHMLQSATIKSTEKELLQLLEPAHLGFIKYVEQNAPTIELLKEGEGLMTKYTQLLNELKTYAKKIAPKIEAQIQSDAKTIQNQANIDISDTAKAVLSSQATPK